MHSGINIFMLKIPTEAVFVNRLASSGLRNVPSGSLNVPFRQAETGHVASQNKRFQWCGMRILEYGEMAAEFSCAFASMGR